MDTHPTTGIYPLAQLEEFAVAEGFPDPRGWAAYGSDRQPVGTVDDVLVDLSTLAVRYLDVRIGEGAARHVLVPVGLASTDGPQRVVVLDVPAARTAALPPYAADARGGPLGRGAEGAVLRALAASGAAGTSTPPDNRYYDRPEFATERFYRGFAGAPTDAPVGGTGTPGASAPLAAAAPASVASAPTAPVVTAPAGAPAGDQLRLVAMGEEAVVTTRRVVKEVLVIKRRRVVEQQAVEVDLRTERVDVDQPARG